jgi:hypothetical protein
VIQDQIEATRILSDRLNNEILPEVTQNIENARLILHTGFGNFELILNKTYILGGLGIIFLIVGGYVIMRISRSSSLAHTTVGYLNSTTSFLVPTITGGGVQ